MGIIGDIEKDYLRTDSAQFRSGDTVIVNVKIKEGDKERIQAFEGIVIAKKRGGVGSTFTVRKISYGVGVERIFPLNSPSIEGIKVKSHGRVRRKRLYYLRTLKGKSARVESQTKVLDKEGEGAASPAPEMAGVGAIKAPSI